jgi:hypothetical protein
MNEDIINKRLNLQNKINASLDNVYFDVQGFDATNIAETQIARLLTKVAVGSVTVLWSILELKSLIKFKRVPKG